MGTRTARPGYRGSLDIVNASTTSQLNGKATEFMDIDDSLNGSDALGAPPRKKESKEASRLKHYSW